MMYYVYISLESRRRTYLALPCLKGSSCLHDEPCLNPQLKRVRLEHVKEKLLVFAMLYQNEKAFKEMLKHTLFGLG